MNRVHKLHPSNNRRAFLRSSLGSFGALAFAGLLDSRFGKLTAASETAPETGVSGPQLGIAHLPPRAKSIIFLYMEGGPSQVDTFDHKPLLAKRAGEPLPFEKPSTVFNSSNLVMPSPFKFHRHGQTGSWVSEILPHVASCVDDLTFIHSMHHDMSNHSAACFMSHTGDGIAGRPSMGSWITYGLGSENDDLPGFVVLDCGQGPSGGSHTWGSGFLPAAYSGVKFNRSEVAVEFIDRLEKSKQAQAAKLEAILKLNRSKAEHLASDDDVRLNSIIASYEKAARMQVAVPDLLDVSNETELTRKLYGMDDPKSQIFGSRCLLARRLVERGVRFIELFSPRVKADRWDQHRSLTRVLHYQCNDLDASTFLTALSRHDEMNGLLPRREAAAYR